MKQTDKWWSYPAEADNGRTIIVTGRDEVEPWRDTGKYVYRIDVTWEYEARRDGMPCDEDARRMDEATAALLEAFKKDPAAVMTGIYTGDGRREWIFYTRSLPIFQKVFNRALEPLDQMPLAIEASEDADWSEYSEMREATYIPPEE